MPEYKLGRFRGGFAVVWYEDKKRFRRELGTNDPRLAKTRFAEYVQRLEARKRPSDPTIAQIFSAYLADRTAEGRDSARISHAWSALSAHFGPLLPRHIDKGCCQRYAEARARSVLVGTIRTELTYLRAAVHFARREGYIDRAPPVWLPSKPPPRERYLTRDEADMLLASTVMPHVRLFIQIGLRTGARAAAILDLQWRQVDLVRRQIDFNPPGRVQTVKRRPVVPINETLLAALQDARKGALSEYVVEWSGQRVRSIKKGFARAAERAGLEGVSPHVLRHTAAVWMAEASVPMSVISQYLGHTDSRTTERVYARYSPDFLRGASNALA